MINLENIVQEEREKEENCSNENPQKRPLLTDGVNFSLTSELACLIACPNEAYSFSIYTLYKTNH